MKWTDINKQSSYAFVPAAYNDATLLPATNSMSSALDNRLRQKIAQLEAGVDRLNDKRKMLEANAEQIKQDIAATFADQLSVLRSRESALNAELEQLVQAKLDDIESHESKLADLIGQCKQLIGKSNGQQATLLLQRTIPRCESTTFRFDADSAALRELSQVFGDITMSCVDDTEMWLAKPCKNLSDQFDSMSIANKINESNISFTEYFAKVLAQPNEQWLVPRSIDADDQSFDLCHDVETIDSRSDSMSVDDLPANANRQSTIEAILVPQKKSDHGIPFEDVFRSVLDSDRQLWLMQKPTTTTNTCDSIQEPIEVDAKEPPLSAIFNEYLATLSRNQQPKPNAFHPYPCACCYKLPGK